MQNELQDLNCSELRALLRQETRKFLLLLEREGTIEELEIVRAMIRTAGDLLKEKELASTGIKFTDKKEGNERNNI
ncbi:hypothetical protein [Niastella sp. OAS944]|uniref:hypothetical protein n=1 Tax=Niastella sp. OAS944 TaxID=2664089 RepID=UPI0034818754|nr:hypothetical protein [Chitinophagaceae bacterium OAS944]